MPDGDGISVITPSAEGRVNRQTLVESAMFDRIDSGRRNRPMQPSAKVIAFRARAEIDPPADAAQEPDGLGDIRNAGGPKQRSWLVWLLAPLIVAASLLLFLAVVGVWLVWLIIVSLLVAGVIVFARRLVGRPGGFGRRTIS
jgi:hypothetical protein